MLPSSSGPVDVLDLIPACARVHLQCCKDLRAPALGLGLPAADIVCVMQSPHQIQPRASPSLQTVVPALLTGALPYSLAADRLVLPDELLLAMGVHSLVLSSVRPSLAALHPFQPPLPDILQEVDLRRLVGNGMHVSQVGSALLLLLCEAMLQL